MPTRDIPRAEWPAFFDHFSRTRQGRLVLMETVDKEDPHLAARALPLVGVTLEVKGSDAGQIADQLGTAESDHVTHTVAAPKHVYHKTEKGPMSDEVDHDEVLEITSDDQPPITYLRFQRPD